MKYVVDTCSLLEGAILRNYEKEYFPVHWENFDLKVDQGIIVSTSLVYKELKYQDDEFYQWAKNRKDIFKPPCGEVQKVLTDLFNTFPKWAKHNYNQKFTWADPELIAFAKVYNLVLVTQEKQPTIPLEEERYKIPTICKNYGVGCIDILELIKREKLHIHL
jgi:hypothetical protein